MLRHRNPIALFAQLRTIADEQHCELLAELRGIEALVERVAPPAQGDVERRLDALAVVLARQARDERSAAIAAALPHTMVEVHKQLARRRSRYRHMARWLRKLARVVACSPSLAVGSRVSVDIRRTIGALRQHEAQESYVLCHARVPEVAAKVA